MPEIDIRPLKPNTSNEDILNAIRRNASPEYQRRIPEATKAGVQDNLQRLTEYRPTWNEFVDALINRIGLVIVKNNIWTNPLAKFKRGLLQFGDTIEEINVGLIKSRVYDPDRLALERDIFGNYPPDVQSSFHKINRQEYYPVTINEPLLQRAFIENSGLQNFVTSVMQAPTNSDQWDEFLITTSLFAEYYRAGGFFKVHVEDVSALDSDAPDAKGFLRLVRGYAGTLQFMSTHYNAAGMPMAVNPEDLELFITPEALAAIDVEALAAAFNIEKANMPGRITIIPQEYFGIPGAQAVLTTRDFFVIADSRIETASIWNPVSLSNNMFLHHWEVISASRFVPAILFTTEPGDVITIPETPVVGVSTITVVDEDGVTLTELVRGTISQVIGSAVTDPTGGPNDAVRLIVAGNVSSHTWVSSTGVLHVALDEDATSLTVHAYAVDTDIPQLTASVTLPVVGDKAVLWPEPHVDTDSDFDGDFEIVPIEPDEDPINNFTIPNVEGAQYRKTVVDGVTFTDTGDIVTVPSHGAEVGDTIVFGAITTTTGVVAATTYYVKTVPTEDTMTISATPGGAILALTTNGSAASARFDVDAGSVHVIEGETIFTVVAEAGYELAVGATDSWTFDV